MTKPLLPPPVISWLRCCVVDALSFIESSPLK
jgi:hypothetical protein